MTEATPVASRDSSDSSQARDLTVVVPAWDGYVKLVPGLIAALRLEAPGAEIVVIDNASSVPLPELETQIVRLRARTTTGVARNAGLAEVRSPFVCFFDADDFPVSAALVHLLDVARRRHDCVGVGGASIAWHPRSSKEIKIGFSKRILRLNKRPTLFAIACLIRNRWPVVGAVLRTAAVRDAGGFSDLNYCEDWALATALAFRGRVCLTAEAVIMSRIHEGSMINREGTPMGIVRTLLPIYRRWIGDAAIPLWVKTLFLITPLPRLNQALRRRRAHMRSHDDLLAVLGRHSLGD